MIGLIIHSFMPGPTPNASPGALPGWLFPFNTVRKTSFVEFQYSSDVVAAADAHVQGGSQTPDDQQLSPPSTHPIDSDVQHINRKP